MSQPAPGTRHPPLQSSATTTSSEPNYQNNSTQDPRTPPLSKSSTATTTMIGASVPWNPNSNVIPAYPSDETLTAEYRAFLDNYQQSNAVPLAPSQTHSSQPHPRAQATGGLGYGHEENDNTRRAESRDSTSPYSTATAAHYASPDPYPPFNQGPIDFNLGHPQSLITSNDSNRRPTVDQQQSQQQQQQMYAVSPESFSSLESPHSIGMTLSAQQQQQYFPQEYYGGAPGYGGNQHQASPNWNQQQQHQRNPQISADYNTYNQQHPGYQAHADHPRPLPSATAYPGYYGQSTGVAPNQVLGNSVHGTGARGGSMNQQVNNQGRIIATPSSRKEAINRGSVNPPTAAPRVPSGNGAQRPTIKPPQQQPRVPNKKRKANEEPEEDSESSDEYYGDEQYGSQRQSTGAGGSGPSGRLPGACAPCKRLKMKCVFPDGQIDCCQRCRNSGRANQCIVGPRKPRQPSNKKEMLLQKLTEQETVIKSKDAVIQSLLEQLQNPHVRISLKDESISSSAAAAAGIPTDMQASHDDKPIDKAILEWVARAQESIRSTPGFKYIDGRVLDEGSESSGSSEFGRSLGHDHLSPAKSHSESGRSGSRLAAPDATGGAGGPQSAKSSPKLRSLPLETTPVGLLAEMSLEDNKEREKEAAQHGKGSPVRSKTRSTSGAEESESHTGMESSAGGGEDEDDGAIGVANRSYFQPAPASHHGITNNMMERKNIPEIMTSGLISPSEVDKLFKIYFERLNVFISILDPVLHTPATTFGRCPFLFTVVCAISSRYHTDRPELYSIAMHFARRAAASSLIEGAKSVELCQAYILMSVYSMPSRRWEDAREWLYLGLAIRMATDLNLHVKSNTKILNEHHEREILNRTRTWLNIYNLDRSASAQLGRPASIRADPIIRSATSRAGRQPWWKSSPVNDPFDLHLCAYTELLSTVIAEFQERVYYDPKTETTGLRTDLDLVKTAFEFDEKLLDCNSRLAISFATHSDASSPQCAYRTMLLPFYVNYLRLVMLSLGFQQAMQRGAAHVDPRLVKNCLDAACGLLKTVVDDLAPTGYLRYAPDGHFVFSSFASAFLIKLLKPEHAALLEPEKREYIINLVERLIETLKSPRIAVDVRHTPMLYSRFLAGLLNKYKPSENVDDGAASVATQSDTIGLPTPPQEKREPPSTPDLSGGRSFNSSSGMSRHKPSPSIEISPPPPEPSSGIPPPPSQMLYDPTSVEGALYPQHLAAEDGYAASTIHPASTVHGSQYGVPDAMMMDDHILAPMLAMDAPGFWDSMLLPGLSWPAEDRMQWMGLDADDGSSASHPSQYQPGDGY